MWPQVAWLECTFQGPSEMLATWIPFPPKHPEPGKCLHPGAVLRKRQILNNDGKNPTGLLEGLIHGNMAG